jgi:hypothetical protein
MPLVENRRLPRINYIHTVRDKPKGSKNKQAADNDIGPTPDQKSKAHQQAHESDTEHHIAERLLWRSINRAVIVFRRIAKPVGKGITWFLKPNSNHVIAGAAVVTMFATIVYVMYASRQWEALLEANKITTASLLTSHRPWVAIDGNIKSVTDVSFADGKVHATVAYSIKNFGSSPALAMTQFGGLSAGPLDNYAGASGCPKAADVKRATTGFGLLLVPGATFDIQSREMSGDIITKRAVTTPDFVLKRFGLHPPLNDGSVAVIVTVCLVYKDEFDQPHATGAQWNYVPADGRREFTPAGTVKGQWSQSVTAPLVF